MQMGGRGSNKQMGGMPGPKGMPGGQQMPMPIQMQNKMGMGNWKESGKLESS